MFGTSLLGKIEVGFSDRVFQMLKLRCSALGILHRQCSLVFDEMSLKSHVSYDKHHDIVEGIGSEGKYSNQALVFMIRGLASKWKQPIGCFFHHGTVPASELAILIPLVIRKLYNIGLFVRCIVCDQGPTNISAVKLLGFDFNKPFISCSPSTSHIHVIFDVPHLFKNLRNNLMRKDIIFGEDIVKWQYIKSFYQLDNAAPIRLAPKLTERHIEPGNQLSMR